MTRRMIAPLLFGLVGVAILLALGVWQLQRLDWKRGVIAEIDARLAAAPVPVPPHPDPIADRYIRVRAEGVLRPGEVHVYTGLDGSIGYRIIAPLALADGRTILLDRGFVPLAAKDTPRPLGPLAVTGTLVWPQDGNPDPDRARNIWLGRDVPLLAEALGTDPVLLVAAQSTGAPPDTPLPIPVTIAIPNDHLQYAITWFGLAVVWSVMTGYLLWRIKRRID